MRTLVAATREAVAAQLAEAVFVGFPKSGNTWVRLLVGSYVKEQLELRDLPLFDDQPLRRSRGPIPRYRFTHGPLQWSDQRAEDLRASTVTWPYAGTRTVLVVRHPLDVLVSHWHHNANRSPPLFTGSLSAFVDDPVFGLDKLIRFHQLWAPRVAEGRVHLLRYEELHRDTHGRAAALLEFLGLPVVATALNRAIAATTFSALRALEAAQPDLRYRSGAAVFSPRSGAGESPHIRRGVIGSYRDEMDPGVAARLEARVAIELPAAFGYAG